MASLEKKNLEKEISNFEGEVDSITFRKNRPGYNFITLVSEKKHRFVGYTKQVPPYIKQGDTTRISYKLDKNGDYLILSFTPPGSLS